MALTPEQIERYIAQHGPYLYHGCANRDGVDPHQVVARIRREGLRPGMRGDAGPMPTPPWGEGEEQTGNREHEDWWMAEHAEWWLHPRPGHVFLTCDPDVAYGPPVLHIDIRQLDPSRIKADEDFLRDHGIRFADFPHRADDPRLRAVGEIRGGLMGRYWTPASDRSLGEQAELIDWGEHPLEAEASLLGWEGHCAYAGTIEPRAIEIFHAPDHAPSRPALASLEEPPRPANTPGGPAAPQPLHETPPMAPASGGQNEVAR